MELAKSTNTVEEPWNENVASVARAGDALDASSAVDQDVARAWDVKASLRWVRNDHGPVNGFRWLLWDRYGLGRPPSAVEHRPIDDPAAVIHDPASPVPTLRLVAFEGGGRPETRSIDDAARMGVVDHS